MTSMYSYLKPVFAIMLPVGQVMFYAWHKQAMLLGKSLSCIVGDLLSQSAQTVTRGKDGLVGLWGIGAGSRGVLLSTQAKGTSSGEKVHRHNCMLLLNLIQLLLAKS